MKTLQIIKQDQDKTISLVEHETSHTKYCLLYTSDAADD